MLKKVAQLLLFLHCPKCGVHSVSCDSDCEEVTIEVIVITFIFNREFKKKKWKVEKVMTIDTTFSKHSLLILVNIFLYNS